MRKLIISLFGRIIREEAQKICNTSKIEKFQELLKENKVGSKVFVICEDSKRVSEDLGIPDEELERLNKLVEQSIQKEKTFTMAMEKVSAQCRNNQELAYICFRLGGEAVNQMNMQERMQGNLGNLGVSGDLSKLLSGDINSRLDALADKMGVPREQIRQMYNKFRKDNGL